MSGHDPIAEFRALFDKAKASETGDATACCLATADTEGRPAARMVLLKDADDQGFTFYTNLDSRKAAELRENIVAKGDQRGRTIGFPTLNLDPENFESRPPDVEEYARRLAEGTS